MDQNNRTPSDSCSVIAPEIATGLSTYLRSQTTGIIVKYSAMTTP